MQKDELLYARQTPKDRDGILLKSFGCAVLNNEEVEGSQKEFDNHISKTRTDKEPNSIFARFAKQVSETQFDDDNQTEPNSPVKKNTFAQYALTRLHTLEADGLKIDEEKHDPDAHCSESNLGS